MRFSDLTVGSEFIFEGSKYCKTSPILASDETGKSRMIPRSAHVESISGSTTPRTTAPVDKLDRFHAETRRLLEHRVHDVELLGELKHSLQGIFQTLKDQDKQ